jgi:integrase
MSLFRRSDVWWYEFWFAGRRIQESSKSPSKTIARNAEQKRRRELEEGFNNFTDTRRERVRTFSDVADEFFNGYKLRLPNSAVFADYAIDHLKRLLGSKMLVDFSEAAVIKYQNDRLDEGTAPKTINEEVGFLLRILGEPGDILRVRLRKRKMLKLKVRNTIGKAYSEAEKERMLQEARKARSPHIYLALTLALNAGMRDAEIKTLTWAQINFGKEFLAVGRSKTEGGEGRTIPLNSALLPALTEYVAWYTDRFGEIQPEWYVFPFGKPCPSDPTRPVTTLKTAWTNVRENAKVIGRFHDNRHTLITELAESGAGDQTIMDIAGHVSKQMLKHYSHIRMEAKRTALESIVKKPMSTDASVQQNGQAEGGSLQKSLHGLQNGATRPTSNHATAQSANSATVKKTAQQCSELPVNTQHFEGESLQKSLQSCNFEGHRGVVRGRKLLKGFGSSGRTRTYNPSVNSCERVNFC